LFFTNPLTKETEKKLIGINAKFYEAVNEDFSTTRQSPWTGWEKLWQICQVRGFNPKSIFDVGCGNARFLAFIREKCSGFKYLGVDNSQAFINTNKINYGNSATDFQLIDVSDPLSENIIKTSYDLILLMAVLHHIPGYANRLELLKQLSSALSTDGIFVVTYWNFLSEITLTKKIYPWSEVSLNVEDLEVGDYLLNWGHGSKYLRYCHLFSTDEKKKLVNDLGLELISTFESDGRNGKLNTYHIFTK
jgi:tRNA (uracil-5-)-methyltransferase TRM9